MSEKNSENQARERLREALSATLDGQASELEFRRVLDAMEDNDELRSVAHRYQAVGDAIRGEANKFTGVDLSAGIMNAIEQDGERLSEKGATETQAFGKERASVGKIAGFLDSWWSPFGRVAIAASMAFAVVFGVKQLNSSTVDVPLVAVNEPSTLSQPVLLTPGGYSYGASGIRAGYNSKQHDSVTPQQLAEAQNLAKEATKKRFQAYALQHAELTTINSGQGILPFARLTSFDAQ